MRGSLQLRDGSDFDSNSVALAEVTVSSGFENLTLRGDSRMQFTCPADADWLSIASYGDILNRTLDGQTREWRLSTITEDSRSSVVTVECLPMQTLLGDIDIVHSLAGTGGTTYWNEGGAGLDANLFLQAFVESILEDHGITWITVGSFDSAKRFKLNFDGSTLLEVCLAAASRVKGEFVMERDEGNGWYELSIYDALNATATEVPVSDARMLQSLNRRRHPAEMVTIAIPRGGLPAGASNRFNAGQAVWEVDGAPSGGWVSLVDPNGGDGPIGFDGQFDEQGTSGDYRDYMAPRYLLKRNGDLEAVIDSDYATQAVRLSDTTNIADGDMVELRKNSDGDLATEIESPAGLAASGRVIGKVDRDDMRGERNWTPNSFFADGYTASRVALCDPAGAQSGTSIDVENLPADYVINADSMFWRVGTTAVSRITTGTTADGSGNATLTLENSLSVSDGNLFLIIDNADLPTEWTKERVTTNPPVTLMWLDASTGLTSDTGTKSGSQTLERAIVVTGFDANLGVQAGDELVRTSTGVAVMVANDVTLNGSGAGTIEVVAGFTANDTDALEIRRPNFGTIPRGKYGLLVLPGHSGSFIESGQYTIKPIAGISRVIIVAKYKLVRGSGSTGWSTNEGPRLVLYDKGGSSEIASVRQDPLDDFSDDDERGADMTLMVDATLSADTDVAARFYPPLAGQVYPVLTHIGVYQLEGNGEPVPVNGSHANELHQEANKVLLQRDVWTTSYSGRASTFSDRWALDPADPALMIGGTVHLVGTGQVSVNERVRLVEQRIDMVTALEDLTFNQVPEGLARKVNKATPAALFVDVGFAVDIQVDLGTGEAEAEVEETVIPTPEPPDKPGVPRVTVPDAEPTLPSTPPARVVIAP